jgi:hypothetical protein
VITTNSAPPADILHTAEKAFREKTSDSRFVGLRPPSLGALNSRKEPSVSQRITAQDAARQLPELLHRVRDEHETFVIVEDGEEIGQLSPVMADHPTTLGSFFESLRKAERPDEDFARDLEQIQAEQPLIGEGPWGS